MANLGYKGKYLHLICKLSKIGMTNMVDTSSTHTSARVPVQVPASALGGSRSTWMS